MLAEKYKRLRVLSIYCLFIFLILSTPIVFSQFCAPPQVIDSYLRSELTGRVTADEFNEVASEILRQTLSTQFRIPQAYFESFSYEQLRDVFSTRSSPTGTVILPTAAFKDIFLAQFRSSGQDIALTSPAQVNERLAFLVNLMRLTEPLADSEIADLATTYAREIGFLEMNQQFSATDVQSLAIAEQGAREFLDFVHQDPERKKVFIGSDGYFISALYNFQYGAQSTTHYISRRTLATDAEIQSILDATSDITDSNARTLRIEELLSARGTRPALYTLLSTAVDEALSAIRPVDFDGRMAAQIAVVMNGPGRAKALEEIARFVRENRQIIESSEPFDIIDAAGTRHTQAVLLKYGIEWVAQNYQTLSTQESTLLGSHSLYSNAQVNIKVGVLPGAAVDGEAPFVHTFNPNSGARFNDMLEEAKPIEVNEEHLIDYLHGRTQDVFKMQPDLSARSNDFLQTLALLSSLSPTRQDVPQADPSTQIASSSELGAPTVPGAPLEPTPVQAQYGLIATDETATLDDWTRNRYNFWVVRTTDTKRIVEQTRAVSSNEFPVIVSIGSGTAIAEYQLARQGAEVYAVDPDPQQVQAAVAQYELQAHPTIPNVYIPLPTGKSAGLRLTLIQGSSNDFTQTLRQLGVQTIQYSSQVQQLEQQLSQATQTFATRFAELEQRARQLTDEQLDSELPPIQNEVRQLIDTQYQHVLDLHAQLKAAREQDIEQSAQQQEAQGKYVDAFLNSWMPPGLDYLLERHGAKLIFNVRSTNTEVHGVGTFNDLEHDLEPAFEIDQRIIDPTQLLRGIYEQSFAADSGTGRTEDSLRWLGPVQQALRVAVRGFGIDITYNNQIEVHVRKDIPLASIPPSHGIAVSENELTTLDRELLARGFYEVLGDIALVSPDATTRAPSVPLTAQAALDTSNQQVAKEYLAGELTSRGLPPADAQQLAEDQRGPCDSPCTLIVSEFTRAFEEQLAGLGITYDQGLEAAMLLDGIVDWTAFSNLFDIQNDAVDIAQAASDALVTFEERLQGRDLTARQQATLAFARAQIARVNGDIASELVHISTALTHAQNSDPAYAEALESVRDDIIDRGASEESTLFSFGITTEYAAQLTSEQRTNIALAIANALDTYTDFPPELGFASALGAFSLIARQPFGTEVDATTIVPLLDQYLDDPASLDAHFESSITSLAPDSRLAQESTLRTSFAQLKQLFAVTATTPSLGETVTTTLATPTGTQSAELTLQSLAGQGFFGIIHRGTLAGEDVALKSFTSPAEAQREIERSLRVTQLAQAGGLETLLQAQGTVNIGGDTKLILPFVQSNTLQSAPVIADDYFATVRAQIQTLHARSAAQGRPLAHTDLHAGNLNVQSTGAPLVLDWGGVPQALRLDAIAQMDIDDSHLIAAESAYSYKKTSVQQTTGTDFELAVLREFETLIERRSSVDAALGVLTERQVTVPSTHPFQTALNGLDAAARAKGYDGLASIVGTSIDIENVRDSNTNDENLLERARTRSADIVLPQLGALRRLGGYFRPRSESGQYATLRSHYIAGDYAQALELATQLSTSQTDIGAHARTALGTLESRVGAEFPPVNLDAESMADPQITQPLAALEEIEGHINEIADAVAQETAAQELQDAGLGDLAEPAQEFSACGLSPCRIVSAQLRDNLVELLRASGTPESRLDPENLEIVFNSLALKRVSEYLRKNNVVDSRNNPQTLFAISRDLLQQLQQSGALDTPQKQATAQYFFGRVIESEAKARGVTEPIISASGTITAADWFARAAQQAPAGAFRDELLAAEAKARDAATKWARGLAIRAVRDAGQLGTVQDVRAARNRFLNDFRAFPSLVSEFSPQFAAAVEEAANRRQIDSVFATIPSNVLSTIGITHEAAFGVRLSEEVGVEQKPIADEIVRRLRPVHKVRTFEDLERILRAGERVNTEDIGPSHPSYEYYRETGQLSKVFLSPIPYAQIGAALDDTNAPIFVLKQDVLDRPDLQGTPIDTLYYTARSGPAGLFEHDILENTFVTTQLPPTTRYPRGRESTAREQYESFYSLLLRNVDKLDDTPQRFRDRDETFTDAPEFTVDGKFDLDEVESILVGAQDYERILEDPFIPDSIKRKLVNVATDYYTSAGVTSTTDAYYRYLGIDGVRYKSLSTLDPSAFGPTAEQRARQAGTEERADEFGLSEEFIDDVLTPEPVPSAATANAAAATGASAAG